jgi:hypothetical protein
VDDVNDEPLRTRYGEHLATRSHRGVDCASPEDLLAVADGSASEPGRLRTLSHVGGCRHCQADLDLLMSAREAAVVAMPAPTWRRFPVLAAASIVLVLGGGFVIREAMRGSTTDPQRDVAASVVRLIAPAESLAAAGPVHLVWATVPGARSYEVEIVRPSGEVVYTTSTRDTTVLLPAATLVPGADYRWWVVAVLSAGNRSSGMRRLRITTP